MKCRIVYKPDKSVCVVHPVPKSRRANESEEQWLERVFSKAMQGEFEGLPYDDVDSSVLPQREHRYAWEGRKGKPITVNQTKVQDVEKEKQIKNEEKKLLREQAIASLAKK